MASRQLNTVGIIGSTAKAALWLTLGAFVLGGVAVARQAFAQDAAENAPAAEQPAVVLGKDDLAKLVGRIALYPDDLVAIVLPASTYPLQVVQAGRLLESRKKDSTLKPPGDWDDSVVALLNYPEVVKLMNDDLDWTWKLGDAVINQRGDVLDAIQSFRDRAYAAGNLKSDDRQVVQNDGGEIEIKPADPQVIYVPYYEPERVVVYQSTPAYYYYPWSYPVYYYPYPFGYSFASGYFWGVTSAFVIGWHSHYVNVYHCGYAGHPYYGHSYYDPYYVRHDANLSVSRGHYVWQPHYQAGSQPFTRSDGHRFTGPGQVQGGAHAAGGYRSNNDGAVSRSVGQQRHVAGDPPRADGGTATHTTLAPTPEHGQLTTREQVRDELRARSGSSAGSAALRSPGQYRSGDAGSASHGAAPQHPDAKQNPAGGTASKEPTGGSGRAPGQYRGNAPAAPRQPAAQQPSTSQQRFVVPNTPHAPSNTTRAPAGDARSLPTAPGQAAHSPTFVSPPPARAANPNRGGAAAPPTVPPRASVGAGNGYRSAPVNPGRGGGNDPSFSGRAGGGASGAPHDAGGVSAPPAPSGGGVSRDSGSGGNPGGGHGGGASQGGGHRSGTR